MIFTSSVRANRNQTFQLSHYLAKRFTYYTCEEWLKQITAGKIYVDEQITTTDITVVAGQAIGYDAGQFDEPPADCTITIIYEDDWLFAVNKPGNLLVHRAGRSFKNNLMYQLRTVHTPRYGNAYAVHRLDRNTSGVVLIAKSGEVQAEISKQFIDHKVDKEYIAFVENTTPAIAAYIDAPIAQDTTSKKGSLFQIDPNGKTAFTSVVSVEPLGTNCLKLRMRPRTGRTHQLRVHCAYAGHPIIGDRTYGSQLMFSSLIDGYIPLSDVHPRHALHCESVVFYHPWLKKECALSAPLPEDMITLEERLRTV